jgi:hypothetical protein
MTVSIGTLPKPNKRCKVVVKVSGGGYLCVCGGGYLEPLTLPNKRCMCVCMHMHMYMYICMYVCVCIQVSIGTLPKPNTRCMCIYACLSCSKVKVSGGGYLCVCGGGYLEPLIGYFTGLDGVVMCGGGYLCVCVWRRIP